MKYVYVLLLILAASSGLASVYASLGDPKDRAAGGAWEGLARGDESFTTGLLHLQSTIEKRDGTTKVCWGNCCLIAADKILTCKHLLQKSEVLPEDPTHVSVGFSLASGGNFLMPVKSSKLHPDLDLAIATLEGPLPLDRMGDVTILPMLLEPVTPLNGYVVSISDVWVLNIREPIATDRRHIAIWSVAEKLIGLPGEKPQKVWAKVWDMEAGDSTPIMEGLVFKPRAEDHPRLTAFPVQGNSGAAFVIKQKDDGKEKLAGIYTRMLTGASLDGRRAALTCILPLYIAAPWIREQLAL